MHPLLKSGRRLALYLSCWVVIAVLFSNVFPAAVLSQFVDGDAGPWDRAYRVLIAGALPLLAAIVPAFIVYSFVCLSAWYVCRSAPLETTSLYRVLFRHVGASVIASVLWIAFWEAWTTTLYSNAEFFAMGAFYLAPYQSPLMFVSGMLLYWLSSTFHYLLIAFERSREAEKRQLGLEVMAREAELKALRAQIDPHFLFNSLNSISALTATSAEGARRMCLRLAEFFRSSVRLGAEDWISLDQEIEMVRQYLDIEKVRCGDRLTAEVRIGERCGSCRIPPLILQPLVENAVRHGIQSLIEGGWIRVSAVCGDGRLTLAVENPFDPDAVRDAGAGVGLDNIRRRLRALFGAEGETGVSKSVNRFQVEIRIPCSEEKETTDR